MALRTRLAITVVAVVVGPLALGAGLLGAAAMTSRAWLVTVVAGVGLLALVSVWWLTRATTRPLRELIQAADRVAEGELSVRVPVRSGDDYGRLAVAFNRMTLRTQCYVQALTSSRDQLRGHLAVLGDTLSSTHDLDRILRVILQTALTATGARSGAVLLLEPETTDLVGRLAESGDDVEAQLVPIRVPVGAGLLGEVAATGQPRRGLLGPDGPQPHEAEPRCRTYLVVPISAATDAVTAPLPEGGGWSAAPTVRGVLALYDRLGSEAFDATDLVTLRTFASQAAVAVDNVRTHEEVQRLSLTDPLTGLWNYRYLAECLRREVERASRFRRMLTVLALDLDRFKEVNDAYGHPAGDAVLVELARRIQAETREVDLAFRQGGEEFVVLLPETDAAGGATVAERLGEAVSSEPFVVTPRGTHDELRIDVTVSIGIAVFPDHAQTSHGVLDAADDALYAAKAAGRDTHRMATTVPAPVAAAELPIRAAARTPEHDLPQAGSESLSPPGDTAPDDNESAVSGGAQPPRQNRGR